MPYNFIPYFDKMNKDIYKTSKLRFDLLTIKTYALDISLDNYTCKE